MENSKKRKPKKTLEEVSADAIVTRYREVILVEGKKPSSVFKFCKEQGFTESDFYKHFSSFESIEKHIWHACFLKVQEQMNADENFQGFSAREKILTFYFMIVEVLKEDRSFILHQLKSIKSPSIVPGFLKNFKAGYDAWLESVLLEGKNAGEVANRMFLEKQYVFLFWMHFVFILQFWSHDDSVGFERTDAAIEKSVNLAFEIIGKGVIDSALDFGKFIFQTTRS